MKNLKILLIVPKFPNNIASLFNFEINPFGGWIDGLVNSLKSKKNINLNIAVFSKGKTSVLSNNSLNKINAFNIQYHNQQIISDFFQNHAFDVIHIVGIEHSYIKDLIAYLPYEKTLLNITGIQYEYAKYFYSDYNKYNKENNLLLKLNLKYQKRLIKKQGLIEIEILKKAKYVVGRTQWDKSSVLSINNELTYFSCNESLRDNFYTSKKWDIENIERNTIFVSQGASPIKGTHMVIEMVKLLKENFQDIKCYIAGENLLKSNSVFTKLNANYAALIKKLIKKYHLENNIFFTGFLNAEEIQNYMLKANIFLMPSSIENSVNSLQEAMLLGVPCVTSLVGGVDSLIEKDTCLTYSFSDIKDGVRKIAMLINSDHLASYLGNNAIKRIEMLADTKANTANMVNIYKTIVEKNK